MSYRQTWAVTGRQHLKLRIWWTFRPCLSTVEPCPRRWKLLRYLKIPVSSWQRETTRSSAAQSDCRRASSSTETANETRRGHVAERRSCYSDPSELTLDLTLRNTFWNTPSNWVGETLPISMNFTTISLVIFNIFSSSLVTVKPPPHTRKPLLVGRRPVFSLRSRGF